MLSLMYLLHYMPAHIIYSLHTGRVSTYVYHAYVIKYVDWAIVSMFKETAIMALGYVVTNEMYLYIFCDIVLLINRMREI